VFLNREFNVQEEDFKKIEDNSFVVLDDFSFKPTISKSYSKNCFLQVINRYLRHHNVCLCLVIHNLYNNNLFTDILLAPHIFLSYSNLGFYIIRYPFFYFFLKLLLKNNIFLSFIFIIFYSRKLQSRLGGKDVLTFYQEVVKQNFHFCYINCNKNYLINKIDCLLKGEKVNMFLGGEKYIIHKLSEPCDLLPIEQNVNINDDIHPAKEYVNSTYPKQKHLKFAIDIIERNNLIDHNLYFIAFPDLHLADVCAFFNNRFKNKKSTDPRIIKLCKFIQTSKIKFPKVSIKNPVAQKYVC